MVPFFVWFLLLDAPGLVRPRTASGAGWPRRLSRVAIYTDKLDGDIARSRGLVTDFGKIADPIADKLLIGSALVMLSLLGELPWWVTILILVREWGITAAALLRHPLRRDPGLARRQAQDGAADGGHLPLRPPAGLDRAVARVSWPSRHDGGPGHHRLDRRRIRHRGPQAARQRHPGTATEDPGRASHEPGSPPHRSTCTTWPKRPSPAPSAAA